MPNPRYNRLTPTTAPDIHGAFPSARRTDPMSDYCDCCPTNTEHIRQHYDPDGLTAPFESPGAVLEIFRDCYVEPCLLTEDDVRKYIDEIAYESGKAVLEIGEWIASCHDPEHEED
jgi:hypothetical protein